MEHNDYFDLYFFLRSEFSPRELHVGNLECGELTPDACDFIAATIHDWFWPELFGDFLSNHKLKHLSAWLEDLLLDSYDANTDICEILNQLRIINAHRQCRQYFFDANLLSLFDVAQDKHIGLTDLYALPMIVSKYKHICFVETTETNVIDRALCDIYKIPISDKGKRQDIIISHLCDNPSIMLSQIEDSADVVLMQVGEKGLGLDVDGLQSLQKNSREVIQIGWKNDSAHYNYFFIKSFPSPSYVSLSLEYYLSLAEFKNKELEGKWVFKTIEKPKEERFKPRVESYDIKEMWSIFPSDYTLLGYERSFKVHGTFVTKLMEDIALPHLFPIFLINSNIDDILLINNQQDYLQRLRKSLKIEGHSLVFFYIEGNTRIIPFNTQPLERMFLKVILSFLSYTSDRGKLCYWLPFTRYDGAINVQTKEEAKYRLLEWFSLHKPDSVEQWTTYCNSKVNVFEETTYEENAYAHLKQNYDLEDVFPFLKDESALTDMSMNIAGWSQTNEKGKRECRKQPIRNLMLAALGINREQYKYIRKINK